MIGTYLKLGGVVIGLIAAFWLYEAIYNAGVKTGSDRVQLAWDKDKQQIQATADAAIAAATKQKEDALAANEVIANDYQAQLLAARALGATLASRLRDAETRAAANSGAVSKAGDQLGTATGTIASSMGQINGALADALNECGANRIAQEALIKQIKPQL